MSLLDLPIELRNRIYQLAISEKIKPIRADAISILDKSPYCNIDMNLLRVNKQIYDETSSIVYDHIDFGADGYTSRLWLREIGPRNRSYVKRISIQHTSHTWNRLTDLLVDLEMFITTVTITIPVHLAFVDDNSPFELYHSNNIRQKLIELINNITRLSSIHNIILRSPNASFFRDIHIIEHLSNMRIRRCLCTCIESDGTLLLYINE